MNGIKIDIFRLKPLRHARVCLQQLNSCQCKNTFRTQTMTKIEFQRISSNVKDVDSIEADLIKLIEATRRFFSLIFHAHV